MRTYRQYKDYVDIGDFVFVEGHLFRTKTNELSIHATKLVPLTKALRPLPEKFHGLTDIETRYRHRTLDLIVTEESRKRFHARSGIVQLIRRFFDAKDFLEVETPMLHPIAGWCRGPSLQNPSQHVGYAAPLRIAPSST